MRHALISILSIPLLLGVVPSHAQNANRGEHVFRKCLLCHVVDPNAKDLLAPPLHNVVGRKAATIAGFEYSDIMKLAGSKGLVWSPEALFYFLDRPEEFMPGTYMAFAGLDEQERRDLIVYLQKITTDHNRAEQAKRSAPSARTSPPQKSSPQPPARSSPQRTAPPLNRSP